MISVLLSKSSATKKFQNFIFNKNNLIKINNNKIDRKFCRKFNFYKKYWCWHRAMNNSVDVDDVKQLAHLTRCNDFVDTIVGVI